MHLDEITNIQNRPWELFQIPNYSSLPKEEFQFKLNLENAIGEFLQYDLFDLDGLQPVLGTHAKINNGMLGVNPSKKTIDICRKRKTKFQLINLVVNTYNCAVENNILVGKPYNISLMPLQKRGRVSEVSIDWLEQVSLEDINKRQRIYHGFNPFRGSFGLFSIGQMPFGNSIESDMAGFVISTYALATKFDHNDVLTPDIPSLKGYNNSLKDYNKFRRRHYFKKFNEVKPRKVWGCDSPIELFLLQAMDHIGLSPDLQTHICEDGFTTPSFHTLWESDKTRKKMKSITEADFYFPSKKLAIFCDSKEYHSSITSKNKDSKIDNALKAIGIETLRFSGQEINSSPFKCAERIAEIVK